MTNHECTLIDNAHSIPHMPHTCSNLVVLFYRKACSDELPPLPEVNGTLRPLFLLPLLLLLVLLVMCRRCCS